MEEINIKDLLNYFISKLWLILLIMILVLTLGYVYLFVYKVPKYESYTTLVLTRISQDSNSNSAITSNDLSLNQKLVSTYREIIKSKLVLEEVIDELDLDYDFPELYDQVVVTSVQDTEIIKISVSSRDSEEASSIANAIAEKFTDHIVDIYNIENISIIEEAEPASEPYNVDFTKHTIIYVLLGFILSFGLVFLTYYFDKTIRDEEDIEKLIGLPVLGIVPVYKGGKH